MTRSIAGPHRPSAKATSPPPSPPAAPAPGRSRIGPAEARATTRRSGTGSRRARRRLRRRPLLRAEHGRGAGRAAERVVHVAGDGDLDPVDRRIAARLARIRVERGRAPPPLAPSSPPSTSRRSSPPPAPSLRPVVRRAAADAQDDSLDAPLRRRRAAARPCRASSRTAGRVGRAGAGPGPDAAAISITAVRPSPSRPNRPSTCSPQRPGHTRLCNVPPVARDQGRDRPLAAVGHRARVDRRRRVGRGRAAPDCASADRVGDGVASGSPGTCPGAIDIACAALTIRDRARRGEKGRRRQLIGRRRPLAGRSGARPRALDGQAPSTNPLLRTRRTGGVPRGATRAGRG